MTFTGYYLLNPLGKTTGANRVDFSFVIDGCPITNRVGFISINHSPIRPFDQNEFDEIRNAYRTKGEIQSNCD